MKLAPPLLLALLAAPALSQSPCSPGDAARAAMLPLAMQYKLLAHKVSDNDVEDEAPADVSRGIVMLRKSLDVATQAFFHCEAGSDTKPASLQAQLSRFLHTSESKRPEFGAQPYGANLSVNVEQADVSGEAVFVILTFDVECGYDKLLFLFTRSDDGWKRRLNWYADQYRGPLDAFQFIEHQVVAGTAPNDRLIAVIHGHAQCQSVHSAFSIDLLRPASDSAPQQLLDHLHHSFVIDDDFKVAHTSTGLQIRTSVESADSARIYHPGILRFSTNTGRLVLLPVALNARDFVDEWLEEPWGVVRNWSDKDQLRALENTPRGLAGTFGPVRACTSGPNHFQVRFDLDTRSSIYAKVRQNSDSFTMLAITDKPDPTCTGPDIMKKKH